MLNENGKEMSYCYGCNEYFEEDEVFFGLCEKCKQEYSENVDVLYKVGKYDTKKPIELNSFLHSVFTIEEIEEILIEKLKQCQNIKHKLDFSTFIEQDESWFAEKVVEVLKNDKK